MQNLVHLPPDPLAGEALLQDLRDHHPAQGGPGGRIELWNRTTGEITLPILKSKYNHWTRRHIPGAPKTMKLTGNTSEMLRHFEKMIDKWARLLNIQRRQSIKPSGREYHLIMLMGLKGGRRAAP